ncbi:MAG TPA: thioredoxin family protein [Planctomycetota bacterium]|nr:thioredoxin family protein [Planctomycetota bacterium]
MEIDWRKDYESARAEAREKGRLILLHFYLEGRPVCKTMADETFGHGDVARAAREKFVSVRVDVDARPELFEATIGGRGGLATCVLDGEGDVVSALHGFAAPAAFLRFLDRASASAGAVKAAREAVAKTPGDASALRALGEAYRAGDSLRRAEECYRKVVELGPGPDAAASHERLARLRVMRGKNLEARRHLEEARRLDPEGKAAATDRLLLTEGLAFAIERKHQDAARVLRDALQRFPSSEETDHLLYALGFVLHQDAQDKAALEILENAQARYPQSTWIPAIKEQIEHIKNPQPDHTH